MKRIRNLYIIIPVFNERKTILEVIREIKNFGFKKIVVIDDGSTDNTYKILEKEKIILLRHLINRGKGAAIKTGIEAAKMLKADYIVTFDGDGQHNPKDIKNVFKYLNKYDVVLGYRYMNLRKMPAFKIIANYLGNFVTWVLYGLWVKDSQCGLRGYSKKAFSLIDTTNDRYEYDSEVIREISKHKLKFKEVPVNVRYTKYSQDKQQKQSLRNGIRTIYKMFMFS